MFGAGSNGSWSPFDSPFGLPPRSNETVSDASSFAYGVGGGGAPPSAYAFDTPTATAFHPDSVGSEMGGSWTFHSLPRETSSSFCDEAFPFPGRTTDTSGDFKADFDAFPYCPSENCTGPSFPDWSCLGNNGGAPDPFVAPSGCSGGRGRGPPPGFGNPRTDPVSMPSPTGDCGFGSTGGVFEGTPNTFGSAFRGGGAGQQVPCTQGFLYEIQDYILFIQPTWTGWDFNNQPPLQKILEHLMTNLLLHYASSFNITAPNAVDPEPRTMDAEIVEIIDEVPIDDSFNDFDAYVNDIIGNNDSSEESDSSIAQWNDESGSPASETSSNTIEDADHPSISIGEDVSARMRNEASSVDSEAIDASTEGDADPPLEEELVYSCGDNEEQSEVEVTSAVPDAASLKQKCAERDTSEDGDVIPVFELHISDSADSCASDISTETLDAYFRDVDIRHLEALVQRSMRETGTLAHFASLGFLPKPLAARYRDQRTRLMALSLMPLNHNDAKHTQLLEKLYRLYTGNEDVCVAIKGEHWQGIGFLGTDPATDLGSGGMLSLWMMLHLLQHNEERALQMFRESRANGVVYPFAAMCVVATGWVIQAIKSGKLNAIAEAMDVPNHESSNDDDGNYLLAAQRVFVGLMYKFHHVVTASSRQVEDVVRAKQMTERYLKKDLPVIVKIAQVPGILDVDESLFEKGKLMRKLSGSVDDSEDQEVQLEADAAMGRG